MHPTRRKLAEMVHTGEYDSDTKIGWSKKEENREIGDIWEDEFHKYEKKEGYVLKTSKNSDAFQEIRDYIRQQGECKNINCKTIKFTNVDKKLVKRTGYCVDCLAELEHHVRVAGLWSDYENYKIWTRMIIDGKLRLEQVKQAHDELKQVHEYVNEDGTTEKWTMPDPVDEVKEQMMTMIKNGEKEIQDIEEKRIISFNKLKDKNLEHLL